MEPIDTFLDRAPVIPVLTVERVEQAVPLARALVAGGLPVIEVTLRTAAAPAVIAAMAQVDGAIVGAGTVLSAADVDRAAAAGAAFLVSPGLTETTLAAARSAGLPLLPGIATASDLMRGIELGLSAFKFFPAETSGGAAAVKALAAPFGAVRFCPTGGITADLATSYLALPSVACVGGSWVAPPDAVAHGDWARITALAAAARQLR